MTRKVAAPHRRAIGWKFDGGAARLHSYLPVKRNVLATAHGAARGSCVDEIQASGATLLMLEGVPGALSVGADIDELDGLLAVPSSFAAGKAQVQRTRLALERSPPATNRGRFLHQSPCRIRRCPTIAAMCGSPSGPSERVAVTT